MTGTEAHDPATPGAVRPPSAGDWPDAVAVPAAGDPGPIVAIGRRRRGFLFATLAGLVCPCHLPLVALALAGTAAGAFLSDNMLTVALVGLVAFVVLAVAALRALDSRDRGPA